MWNEILAETLTRAEWVLLVLVVIILAGPAIAERFRLPGLLGFEMGDLVVLPGAVARRIVRSRDPQLVEVAETISIMIAAGPYRLTLTSVGKIHS